MFKKKYSPRNVILDPQKCFWVPNFNLTLRAKLALFGQKVVFKSLTNYTKAANTKCLIAPLRTMMASKSYKILDAITFHILKVRRKIYQHPCLFAVRSDKDVIVFGTANRLIHTGLPSKLLSI